MGSVVMLHARSLAVSRHVTGPDDTARDCHGSRDFEAKQALPAAQPEARCCLCTLQLLLCQWADSGPMALGWLTCE